MPFCFSRPASGPRAGRTALVDLQELVPGLREAHQSQRVAGGRGVEDNMVISAGRLRVTNQRRELVEGRDLHGAGAGKLLLDALQSRIGKDSAHRSDNPLAVRMSRFLRVDVQRIQAETARHWSR